MAVGPRLENPLAQRPRSCNRSLAGKLVVGGLSPAAWHGERSTQSTPGTKSFRKSEVERCGCCTIDEFWKMYDIFLLMDRRRVGAVSRADFYQAISDHPTLEMRRMMNRAGLLERFRNSSAELLLQEFVRLIWPAAGDSDVEQVKQWARLREAATVLKEPTFSGQREDLRRIFNILDEDGSGNLSEAEILRSRILTKEEADTLLRNAAGTKQTMRFNEFCKWTQPHFAEKYKKEDVKSPAVREEEWKKNVRRSYGKSRTNMLLESAEDSPRNRGGMTVPARAAVTLLSLSHTTRLKSKDSNQTGSQADTPSTDVPSP